MENMRGRGRGRRARGRGRGRPKKNTEVKKENVVTPEEEEPAQEPAVEEPPAAPKIDMEADISLLEAPTFTTISRGPSEAMLKLKWDHPVNLIGEKVLNPRIYCCDQCLRPVLIYGRMIPCKHVFCLDCAKRQNNVCPRCNENVTRIEQTRVGSIFMCTHGGTRYGNTGCRRTYLSQRDLERCNPEVKCTGQVVMTFLKQRCHHHTGNGNAHINHRHVSAQSNDNVTNQFGVHNNKANEMRCKPESRMQGVASAPPFYENQKPKLYEEGGGMNFTSPRNQDSNNPAPRSSNLITVHYPSLPLQDPSQDSYYPNYSAGYYPTPYQEYSQSQSDPSLPPPPPPPPPPQQWSNNQQFYG